MTHWNAFVANLEMHGKGTFYDPRLNNAAQFPIAAREGFGNVRNTPDLITKIQSGKTYVNVHTLAHPGGEIRSQIR